MSEQEINEIICKNLNYYMKLNDTTQTKLADYIGVSVATVSNWCKGIKTPRMNKVDKICEFFHIQRSDLLEAKEKKDESFNNSQIIILFLCAYNTKKCAYFFCILYAYFFILRVRLPALCKPFYTRHFEFSGLLPA